MSQMSSLIPHDDGCGRGCDRVSAPAPSHKQDQNIPRPHRLILPHRSSSSSLPIKYPPWMTSGLRDKPGLIKRVGLGKT